MSYDPYRAQPVATPVDSATFDVGLQGFMRSVFNTMCMGLALTGLTAYGVASIEPLYNMIFGTPLAWVAMLAPLAFVMIGFTPRKMAQKSSAQLRTTFYIFAAVMGISMAALFEIFAGASIARAFFITAATFGGVSLYGYTTRRDLTGMGSFLFMGLFGIVIASLVNLFMASEMVHFVVSVLSVLIFTGLTAFEVQQLKSTYIYGRQSDETLEKVGIMGALSLYLSFINLFQAILHLTSGRD